MQARHGRDWLVLTLGLGVALVMLDKPASAASCHAHAHAHDITGPDTTSVTRRGRVARCFAISDVPGAHAHGSAAASSRPGRVRKFSGTHGWYRDGNSPKHWWAHARSRTGSFVIEGPDGPVELRVRVSASGSISDEDEEDLDDASPIGTQPSQGAYADDGFAVEWSTHVSVTTDGGGTTVAFSGSGSIGGPTTTVVPIGLTESGDWVGGMTETLGGGRNSAQVGSDIVSATLVVNANEIFMTEFENVVAILRNDPDDTISSDTPPPLESPPDGLEIGAAGSLIIDLELVDQSGTYTLKPVGTTPALSPPAIGILLVSLLGAGAVLVQRARRRGRTAS